MQVKIACVGADTLLISDLVEFQGDLKSLSEKAYQQLRDEIANTGFAFPFHVWRNDGEGGKTYIVGGHQRKRTLQRMEKEGWVIPALPVVYVAAASEAEAKRRVLQDVAQYGVVERQGLYEFMAASQIDIKDLADSFKIPEINIPSFAAEYFEPLNLAEKKERQGSQEISADDFQSFEHKCPKCGFGFND